MSNKERNTSDQKELNVPKENEENEIIENNEKYVTLELRVAEDLGIYSNGHASIELSNCIDKYRRIDRITAQIDKRLAKWKGSTLFQKTIRGFEIVYIPIQFARWVNKTRGTFIGKNTVRELYTQYNISKLKELEELENFKVLK